LLAGSLWVHYCVINGGFCLFYSIVPSVAWRILPLHSLLLLMAVSASFVAFSSLLADSACSLLVLMAASPVLVALFSVVGGFTCSLLVINGVSACFIALSVVMDSFASGSHC
jgi:hypothetical protein